MLNLLINKLLQSFKQYLSPNNVVGTLTGLPAKQIRVRIPASRSDFFLIFKKSKRSLGLVQKAAACSWSQNFLQ